MPASACENDRVPQKVVDQVVVKVAARKEGRRGEFARYQIGYYMGLQQKHTELSVLLLGENLGGRREVLVFMASKGARR